jgi:hypothetical protein
LQSSEQLCERLPRAMLASYRVSTTTDSSQGGTSWSTCSGIEGHSYFIFFLLFLTCASQNGKLFSQGMVLLFGLVYKGSGQLHQGKEDCVTFLCTFRPDSFGRCRKDWLPECFLTESLATLCLGIKIGA